VVQIVFLGGEFMDSAEYTRYPLMKRVKHGIPLCSGIYLQIAIQPIKFFHVDNTFLLDRIDPPITFN
jgi:hypothetical protein